MNRLQINKKSEIKKKIIVVGFFPIYPVTFEHLL